MFLSVSSVMLQCHAAKKRCLRSCNKTTTKKSCVFGVFPPLWDCWSRPHTEDDIMAWSAEYDCTLLWFAKLMISWTHSPWCPKRILFSAHLFILFFMSLFVSLTLILWLTLIFVRGNPTFDTCKENCVAKFAFCEQSGKQTKVGFVGCGIRSESLKWTKAQLAPPVQGSEAVIFKGSRRRLPHFVLRSCDFNLRPLFLAHHNSQSAKVKSCDSMRDCHPRTGLTWTFRSCAHVANEKDETFPAWNPTPVIFREQKPTLSLWRKFHNLNMTFLC